MDIVAMKIEQYGDPTMEQVVVLMSTYNGEKYLNQQIDSIIRQKGVNVSLLVRDDGSDDSTLEILKSYEERGMLKYYSGENIGPAKSFFDLIQRVKTADFVAFSDQDDYWKEDKLLIAINKLKCIEGPAFYDSVAEVVDEALNPTRQIYGSFKNYNFETQVARSNVIGCTMVLNPILVNLIKKYQPQNAVMHDQWIAIVCKGNDGTEIKDSNSYIYYRQHSNNVIGSERSILKRLRKSSLLCNGASRRNQAEEIYKAYKDSFSVSKRSVIQKQVMYKEKLTFRLKCILGKYNSESPLYNALIRISFLRGTF